MRQSTGDVMSARSGFNLTAAGYTPVSREINESDEKKLTEKRLDGSSTDDWKTLWKKVFHEADEANKGYLTRHEVKVAFVELLGYKPTKYEISQMLQQPSDKEMALGNGLTLEKFLICMKEKLAKKDEDDEIRHAFMTFDMQCKGFLTVEDLKKVFSQVAPHVNPLSIQSAFREIDQDCDGRVSYKDFEFLMKYNTEDHI